MPVGRRGELLQSFTVRVPATSANLGPGFDLLGLAVPLYNTLTVSASPNLTITATGPEAAGLPLDATNLAYQAAARLFDHLQLPMPAWHMAMDVQIPQSRGLGSSSAAIVAGLAAANAWLGQPMGRQGLLELATAIEGHPDNVGPAIFGGVTAAFTQHNASHCLRLTDKPPTSLVFAVPAFELSTAEARRVLPAHYARADVIANLGHVTILTTVMLTGAVEWLPYALADRIHQPYRLALIPGAETVTSAATDAGAWGVVISGAGPTLLALSPPARRDAVATAMVEAWRAHGITSRTLIYDTLADGAAVV